MDLALIAAAVGVAGLLAWRGLAARRRRAPPAPDAPGAPGTPEPPSRDLHAPRLEVLSRQAGELAAGGEPAPIPFRFRGLPFTYTESSAETGRWSALGMVLPPRLLPDFQATTRRGPRPVPVLPVTSLYAVGVRPFDDRFVLRFPTDGDRTVAIPPETWFRFARLGQLCADPPPLLEVRRDVARLWFPRDPAPARDPEAAFDCACGVLEMLASSFSAPDPDPGLILLDPASGPAPEWPVCQVCGESTPHARVACARCGTAHHRDCWDYLGRCSTFGCGSTTLRGSDAS